MSEEEIKGKCRIIIWRLIEELHVKVDKEVIEILAEGLINAIRALVFLSSFRANDLGFRITIHRYPRRPLIDLRGKWFTITNNDIERVVQDYLRGYGFFHRSALPNRYLGLAKELNEKQNLSGDVRRIIFDDGAESAIAEYSIAIEASVLDALKRRKRDEKITKTDVNNIENGWNKWFG